MIIVVPGHGEVGDKTLATKYREYFEDVHKRLLEFKKQGMDKETAAGNLADYLMDSYRLQVDQFSESLAFYSEPKIGFLKIK